uniref:Fibronectin type-III domain-containing protein n=1 Tax=Leptobrachium leishanense TaxID=445787 RepID=A0A8C5QVW5_9ANUR
MDSPAINVVLVTILCDLMFLHAIEGSVLLDSLNCVNDYMRHWRCQWKESKAAHAIIPMQLYFWNNLTSPNSNCRQQCITSEPKPQEESPNLSMSCHINSTFSLQMEDIYSFLPKRILQRETNIIPAYKIRTSPPEGIEIQMSDNESVFLSWKSPHHSHQGLSLLYQLSYCRRGWEEWEDAISFNIVDELQVSLSTQLLIPGYTYLFRVRARPLEGQHHKGFWSKWSDAVAWESPKDDKAAPKNVQCEYDGSAKMICSWEVRTEVTLSISYVLYYTEYPDNKTTGSINKTTGTGYREKTCHPTKSSSGAGTPYVQYSCAIHMSPNQANKSLNIQVRPQEELKVFKHKENIQTQPPTNLNVDKISDNGYMVRWDAPTLLFNNIRLSYQLCYWKQGDPECSAEHLVNISGNLPEYYILSSDLQESSVYLVRVRTRPDRNRAHYRGPWSDWSRHTSWKTKKGANSKIIYIVTSVCIVVLLVLITVGYKYIKRALKNWEDSFPNPRKSKLLGGYPLVYKGHNVAMFMSDYHPEEEPPISVQERNVALLQIGNVDEDMERANEECPLKPNECPLGPYTVIPKREEKLNIEHSMNVLSGTPVIINAIEKPLLFSKAQPVKSDYNDPQFIFSQSQALLNIGGGKAKNSEYFSLPICQGDVLGFPKPVNPSIPSMQPKEQMGYVMDMGAQGTPQLSQPKAVSRGYTPLPSPSDFPFPSEGPVLVINPDGKGLIMLKQVGDYCLFPGYGSQDKSEMKMVPIKECDEQHILQDRPLGAIQAFKVMQNGYFALPQT